MALRRLSIGLPVGRELRLRTPRPGHRGSCPHAWTTAIGRRPPLRSAVGRGEASPVGRHCSAERIDSLLRKGRGIRRAYLDNGASGRRRRARGPSRGRARSGSGHDGRKSAHGRDTHHRSLELAWHRRRGGRGRRLGRSRHGARGRAPRGGRGRASGRGRSASTLRLIHHQHGSLELGGRHTFEVKVALRTRLSHIRVLSATVRTEHSAPPRGSGRLARSRGSAALAHLVSAQTGRAHVA